MWDEVWVRAVACHLSYSKSLSISDLWAEGFSAIRAAAPAQTVTPRRTRTTLQVPINGIVTASSRAGDDGMRSGLRQGPWSGRNAIALRAEPRLPAIWANAHWPLLAIRQGPPRDPGQGTAATTDAAPTCHPAAGEN